MAVQAGLSFILIGIFYSSYSIFVRAMLSHDDCFNIKKTANVLENFYILCLIMTVMLSTTIKIEWAELFFKATSLMMGLLTLFIVVTSTYYVATESVTLQSSVFVGIVGLSYMMPLLLNYRNIKLGDFLKGIIYIMYLTPTFINTITIYSICNINDVSWGSRPSGAAKSNTDEQNKVEDFKNFRAWFLVVWLTTNCLVGFAVVWSSRGEGIPFLISFSAYFLLVVLSFKLICSFIFHIVSLSETRTVRLFKDKLTKFDSYNYKPDYRKTHPILRYVNCP